jgi:hypothetical protein
MTIRGFTLQEMAWNRHPKANEPLTGAFNTRFAPFGLPAESRARSERLAFVSCYAVP